MTRFRDVTSPCVVMGSPGEDFTFRNVGVDDP